MGTQMVCGYLKKRFMMSSSEVSGLRRMINGCATEHGLKVDKIFEDDIDMTKDQLSECLFVLFGADEPVLIVPDLSHFAGNGNPIDVKQALQGEGIRVLSARHKPLDTEVGEPRRSKSETSSSPDASPEIHYRREGS